MEYKPTGHYTISKVFHEAMGYSYAQEFGTGGHGRVCHKVTALSQTCSKIHTITYGIKRV
jgi:hypothetical protein